MSNGNVVVCFPARNEEEYLSQVLDSLEKQDHKPLYVIVANDGSTDRTEEIANSYEFVIVKNRPKREGTVVGKKIMAQVWNDSITPAEKIHENTPIDFILFLGGDLALPSDYISKLMVKFSESKDLMMAAGKMVGEFAYPYSGFMIPGGGRMVRYEYWLKIGGRYPDKFGWESYPIYKANMDGYSTKVFEDISYYPLRPTGGRTDYYAYGQAMKALGYSIPFAIARIIRHPFLPGRSIKGSWGMLKGYIFGRVDKYDSELRKFIRNSQRRRLRKLFFRF